MAVFAGKDDRAARAADGVGDVAIAEEHALFRQPVEIRRLIHSRAVRADRVGCVVVSKNKEDVRASPGEDGFSAEVNKGEDTCEEMVFECHVGLRSTKAGIGLQPIYQSCWRT